MRLPDNQMMAQRRFQNLEKRMQKDERLAETINKMMADYLSKGYIRKLSDEELYQAFQRVWYLPVFPVYNPNKPRKVRMVWDAAAKIFGVSLNSTLLKGPDMLSSLFSELIRFRERSVALTGDIREMFHQVLMRHEDQQCQRFYWRDERGRIGVYVMRVMTFGACCHPSSAQYIMNLNAKRFINEYPNAVEAIEKWHYVDDMLVSTNTAEDAIKLAEDVRYIHAKGGFEIRNWISNSKRVLQALRVTTAEEKNLDLSPQMTAEKVLGMWWYTDTDDFTYQVGWHRYDHDMWEGRHHPTSIILGLIAPFLMYLKILLQEIWRSRTQWDEKIDDDAVGKWRKWLQVLPALEKVQVPRCFQTAPGYDEVRE